MEGISNVLEVFDNGTAFPYASTYDSREDHRLRTGANATVATRWTYFGKTYENELCPAPIPDMSGLVYASKDWKTWVVLNPNGLQRFVIRVPRISAQSVPEDGNLGDPRHMRGAPLYIMCGEGSDGDRDDCRFHFDMRTGQLVGVDLVGRHC